MNAGTLQRAVIGLAGICYLVAGYDVWRRERARGDSLQNLVLGQGCLTLHFEPGKRRFEEERGGAYGDVTRTLSVCVFNVGGATVRQIRVSVIDINPNEGGLAIPVLLSTPEGDLNPGDFLFVRIATYQEPGKHGTGDTFGTLHIPFLVDHSIKDHERTLSKDAVYTVTLRATGSGSAACEQRFRIWIGRDSRLRMVDSENDSNHRSWQRR